MFILAVFLCLRRVRGPAPVFTTRAYSGNRGQRRVSACDRGGFDQPRRRSHRATGPVLVGVEVTRGEQLTRPCGDHLAVVVQDVSDRHNR